MISSGKPYSIVDYVTCDRFSNAHKEYLATIMRVGEPRYFHEAIKDSQWREVMAREIEALETNKIWTIVELPPGQKPINCKRVYRVKYKYDGSIECYKACLVIRGDQKIKGLDYGETFASVAKMTSVRSFLAIAAAKGWTLHHMNMNNAFLHGDLHEEVYMTIPPGFRT